MEKKKKRPSLSTNITISLALGVLCGLFLGEYAGALKIVGDAFIKLLQMSILPYIVISLIVGIGSLSYNKAKLLSVKGGLLLLLFWGIGFILILAMPLAFPSLKSASFFSTSILGTQEPINILDMYIPANPFFSMANNMIPAVVLFSIATGVALIGIKDKESLIQPLTTLSNALTKITHFVVKLTPIGVFAITASAAGTITLEELGRLKVFFITLILASLLLIFWILPKLLSVLTPFKYRDIINISQDALIAAFTINNLFIVLPILIKNCQEMLKKYKLEHEDSKLYIDIIIPVFFNFPSLGRLLVLLFIPFAAWFYGNSLSITDYPNLFVSGVMTLFGKASVALPFLLNNFHIPSDIFQLYMLASVINGRFLTMVGAMNLLVFCLLAVGALSGYTRFRINKIFTFMVLSILITVIVIGTTNIVLNRTTENTYTKDKVIAGMQLLHDPVPAVVHKTLPPPDTMTDQQSRLERIRERGTLRVGYLLGRLPFCYINSRGNFVGYDVDMAHKLAKELKVTLEFMPVEPKTFGQLIKENYCDIIMAGIPITTTALEEVSFSLPYLDVTIALIVDDHRRREFDTMEKLRRMEDLTIAVKDADAYFVDKIQEALPDVEIVRLKTIPEFFENRDSEVDSLLASAEGGSAWTLLYPNFSVVIPEPVNIAQPLGYPIATDDAAFSNFINRWIDLKRKDKTIEKLYNYWILGIGAVQKEPRWSIIRNVLHWVD